MPHPVGVCMCGCVCMHVCLCVCSCRDQRSLETATVGDKQLAALCKHTADLAVSVLFGRAYESM